MIDDIKFNSSDKVTYDHSRCQYCGKEINRPYDLYKEIQNVLNEHPVPLSSKEILNYLRNANYDKLNQYIKIEPEHLEKILEEATAGEIIRYVDLGKTYYMTRKQLKTKFNK